MARKRTKIDTKSAYQDETKRKPGRPKSDEETKRTGIGLPASQMDYLDALADELNVTRHSLLRYAVADFIKRHKAGEIALGDRVVKPRKYNLDMPE